MTRRDMLVRVLGLAAAPPPALQDEFPQGIFAAAPDGPVELVAFGERIANGQLRMSYGTFEDVPAVGAVYRIVCNMPAWKPAMAWLSTRAIFRDDRAERRQLRLAGAPVNVFAMVLRIAQLETPENVARLVAQVRATGDNPAYLFLTMANAGVAREYMLELTAPRPGAA